MMVTLTQVIVVGLPPRRIRGEKESGHTVASIGVRRAAWASFAMAAGIAGFAAGEHQQHHLMIGMLQTEAAGNLTQRVETLSLLGSDLTQRGITFSKEGALTESKPLIVPMGARSLKQVYLNLILNAAQAMTAGGRIVARARRLTHQIDLEVEDDGPGMSEEVRRRVLEPFFTTKPTGSGLGLTLVSSLVQARGGSVEIRSLAGRGTVVVAHLPTTGRENVRHDR